MNTFQLEDQYQLTTYAKMPVSIVRGQDVEVFDENGRRYLDLYGGHAVVITGHCHPKVVAAIQEQAAKLMFYSNVVYNDVRSQYLEALQPVLPTGFGQTFFCNSGAEANETALKIARGFTKKKRIIAMTGSFHGRTIGALSATHSGNYRQQFAPILHDYDFAEFGDLKSVKSLIGDDTAGIILEPVQSMAGVRLAEAAFYQGLRELCDAHGLVLIFDEVQTAPGRAGTMFVGEHWNVIPDVISTAKGIASGFPMGATFVSNKIAQTVKVGEHGTTFGGSPLACAAALATLQVIQEENLLENARSIEAYCKAELPKIDGIKAVHGLGCLLGIEFDAPVKAVNQALFEQGIIAGTSGNPNVLRLLPPITVQTHHIDELIAVLEKVTQPVA